VERDFSDLIILLASGINQRRMYFDDHPKVKAVCRDFTTRLRTMVAADGLDGFTFGIYGGKFIRQGKYLVGPSIAGRSLIEFAQRLGCGGFTFRLPLAMVDVATFCRLGATTKESLATLEEARDLFAAHGIDHIELSPPFREEDDDEPEGPPESDAATDYMAADFAPLLNVYQALYDTVSSNNLTISRNDNIDLTPARESGAQLVGASELGAMDVMQFMRYPDYDSYTIGHSVRVAALAAMVGRELGWPHDVLVELATAGLVHDLGKGRVPDEILFKNGPLDPEERNVIESHPVTGAHILLASGERSPMVIAATWGHHIREDGRGYPDMPDWYTQGAAASLVHVCDVFEALTAVRPYKSPMSPRRAFEIMLKDKGIFHPHVLATLIRTLGLFPPGSEVLLSDDRKAVVVARGSDLEYPLVRVTHDPMGLPIRRTDQPAIQLEAGSGLDIAEFLLVGITDETKWQHRDDNLNITTGFSEYFQ
jgi:putative nucleotidyltransferase with HDIG domain